MGATTEIAWTDATFNPWIGCTKVAPGCRICYAESFAKRYGKATWGPTGTRVKASDSYWRQPHKWNREAEAAGVRKRVFCASLADVFEDWGGPIQDNNGAGLWVAPSEPDRYVPWRDDFLPHEQANIDAGLYRRATMSDVRASLFRVIDATPNLDWLLLTKRPENVPRFWGDCAVEPCTTPHSDGRSNVWLGTSISDQPTADKAIPHLIACQDLAPVLFLSAEPLLGPINLARLTWRGDRLNVIDTSNDMAAPHIDWVIVGGESGHGARPMHPDWARSLLDQCQAAGVPFLFKQWGEWIEGDAVPGGDLGGDFRRGNATILARDGSANDGHFRRARGDVIMRRVGKKAAGRMLDGREWDEFPEADHV